MFEETSLKGFASLENSLNNMPKAVTCGFFMNRLNDIQGIRFNDDPRKLKILS